MTFSDLAVGQTASLQKAFTEADIATFAEISLDSNPIHLSDEYAKNRLRRAGAPRYTDRRTDLRGDCQPAVRSRLHLSGSGPALHRPGVPR